MTNKELEVIVCNAIDARKEQGTPFDRDAFAALVKMAQASIPIRPMNIRSTSLPA